MEIKKKFYMKYLRFLSLVLLDKITLPSAILTNDVNCIIINWEG